MAVILYELFGWGSLDVAVDKEDIYRNAIERAVISNNSRTRSGCVLIL